MARKKKYTGRSFSPAEQLAKLHIRRLRIEAGHNVDQGAKLMEVSRKVMEDIETMRGYGSHITWNIVIAAAQAYGVGPNAFVRAIPVETIEALWPGQNVPDQLHVNFLWIK